MNKSNKKAKIRIRELDDGLWIWELLSWYGSIEIHGMSYIHKWQAERAAIRVKQMMAEVELDDLEI